MTPWILITAGIAILSSAVSAILFTARARKKVTYMLDALEDNETNFRFREDKGMGKRFNRTLNRLRKIFEREKEEIRQQEQYYGQMLDHVQTGIAVIGNDGEHVEYCNAKALALLGISSLSSIRQLKRINPPLADAFSKVTEGHEEKAGCSNESATMTFSITASSAEIRGKNVKIVAFNDISSDMEENEAASWTRLIRVLTHEIMNTVTPIASLSEALAKYAGDNTGQNTPDMRTGLETIAASSRDLIKFVSSYRDLTHLPFPEKSAFYLKDLIEKVMRLMDEKFSSGNIVCTYTEKSEDILLYADREQISRIFINLLRNAIQAGASHISITAEINTAESVVVNVSNNGMPVSKESREEIFIPFFTTKPSGTGIGLSISRQIMRMHNGSIRLTGSNEKETTFTLTFR